MKRTTIMGILLILYGVESSAQNVIYSYDNRGNVTKRRVTPVQNAAKAVKDELDKLYEKYGSAEENSSLYRSMGGSIKSEVYDKYYELTGNACALKLSKALRRVGYYIEKGTKGSLTDKHGNAYFVSAEIMQEYLSGIPEAHTMNYNNVIDLRNNLNTGFFFQKGGYTNPNIGHIDVVYNRQFPKRLGNGHKKYVGIY